MTSTSATSRGPAGVAERRPTRPRTRGRRAAKTIDPGGGFRFFGGKGGVGKTTCAAAAAIGLADAGRRVLVVSTDPAHSLGDALATRLGPRASRIRTRRGQLYAAELDAERALARWLTHRREKLRVIAERGTYLDDQDIERLLRLSLPGVDELIGLIELARVARARPYEDVVVDTAPTGHTLRFLAMPETVQRIAAVLDHMYAKHRFLAERLGGGYRPDPSDALIEEIDAEGRELHALLRDRRRSSFWWVLLPEALSVEEAKDGLRELSRWGMPVGEVVVNRLTPPPDSPCARCGARIRSERVAVRAVRAAFRGRSLRFVAAAAEEPRGLGALRAIGRRLTDASRGEGLLAGPPPRAPRAERRRRPTGRPKEWLGVVSPDAVRLLLFTGKGGVGKTTCAATAALALADQAPARKILLLSTDPAHSLGDVLAVPLGDPARGLPDVSGGLRARELDADREFRRRQARYREAVDQLFAAVRRGTGFDAAFDRAVVQDLMELAPPGIDELLAMLSVTEALVPRDGGAAAYDMVVVDTAPTGHALRLLALPRMALEWVRALLAILLKYRAVIRPGALAQDLVEMSRDLRQLDALLRDGGATRVVVVTHAAALPRLETLRLLERLRELRMAVSAVIVNAVIAPGAPRCRRCAREAGRQRREIGALRSQSSPRLPTGNPLILTPETAPPPRGVRELRRWGVRWMRPDASPGGRAR